MSKDQDFGWINFEDLPVGSIFECQTIPGRFIKIAPGIQSPPVTAINLADGTACSSSLNFQSQVIQVYVN